MYIEIIDLKKQIIASEKKLGMRTIDSEISLDELSYMDMRVYLNGLLEEIDAIAWE